MMCTLGNCHYEAIKQKFMTASPPYQKNMVIVEGWDRYHKSGPKWKVPARANGPYIVIIKGRPLMDRRV